MNRKTKTITVLLLTGLLVLSGSSRQPGASGGTNADTIEMDFLRDYEALEEPSIKYEAFRIACKGFQSIRQDGLIKRDSIITLIDFSQPSSVERLFVIDLINRKILTRSLVAHGRNSGEGLATEFSNLPQSHKSSLGFYLTGNPYQGANGYSLMLKGLDKGFNDQAEPRAIVIHGADYVSYDYIEQYGRIGRSWGCPALPVQLTRAIIDQIKNGSLLFCYYPDESYLESSEFLNEAKLLSSSSSKP
jgi:hypothetical protein